MIHVLCADISSADQGVYDRLYEHASPERKAQADRCMRREDKLRCLTAHALLKAVLGTEDFRIKKRQDGKPYVENRAGFFYNLSHSGCCVVIAWGGSEVGVDVQRHDASVRGDMIAKRYFTPGEQAYVQGDLLRFYEVWTKKESYLKYTGRGLRQALASFSVLEPDSGIRYRHRYLEGGYSLSLCTTEGTDTFRIVDVRQLLPGEGELSFCDACQMR